MDEQFSGSNAEGNIVIRQEGIGYGEDPGDHIVVIPRDRVPDVIEAYRRSWLPGRIDEGLNLQKRNRLTLSTEAAS